MLSELSDQELLRRYLSEGTEAAFETLARRHLDLVFGAAFRRLHDTSLAEEITQSVFVTLAKRAKWLAGHPSLAGWLYQTTMNQARDRFRSEQRRRIREETAAMLGTTSNVEASALQPLVPVLDETMLELSTTDRETLVLRFFANKNLRDVGTALGIREDAAQKRVARALDALAERFRLRGFRIGSASVVVGALQQATACSAPAALATTTIQAALAAGTSVPAAGGTLALIKIMSLTKTQIALLCVALASVPLGYEWHSLAKIERTQTNSSLSEPQLIHTVLYDLAPTLAVSGFSPDGRSIATVDLKRDVRLWDARTGKGTWTYTAPGEPLRGAVFSPDGALLALFGGNVNEKPMGISLISIKSKTLTRRLELPSDTIWSVAFAPDGKTLAAACRDKTVQLWNPQTGELKKILTPDLSPRPTEDTEYGTTSVAFSPDGRILAAGCRDGSIHLWDTETLNFKKRLKTGGPISRISFSADGKTLASGHTDGLNTWDVETGQLKKKLEGGPVTGVTFSPDGLLMASAGTRYGSRVVGKREFPGVMGELRLWDAQTGELKSTLEDRSEPVNGFAFSPDGKSFAVGSSGMSTATMKIWRVR